MVTVLLAGPCLSTISGVSTHLNQILGSSLKADFHFVHFQVGSEGREETRLQKLWRFLVSPFELAALVRLWRPAAVHLNSSMDAKAFWRDLSYASICSLFDSAVVFQVHGGELPTDFSAGHPIRRRALKWLLRRARVVVVLSETERRAYEAFMPGLSVRVIPNAVTRRNSTTRLSVASSGAEGLALLFLGRIVESKGIFEALQATAHLVEKGVPVRLLIAGSGPAEGRLRAEIAGRKLETAVTVLGMVQGARLDALLDTSDVLVLPTHAEGLPYALLETMEAGLVPVVCPVGAIPEVVSDGVHGFLVPPRDPEAIVRAIRWLAEHPSERLEMSRACQARVREAYTIERLASDFRQVYGAV